MSHYPDALKCYSAPSYYTTKATDYYMTTHAALSYYTEAPKYYSVLCSQLLTAPTLLTTSLFIAATPRLPLITPPKWSSTTVTEAAKYFSATINSTRTEAAKYYPQSRLATKKLLFRATLN